MRLLLLGWGLWLAAQAPPVAALQASGFDHFYNLQYSAALDDFQRVRAENPNRSAAWNHVAQVRLYAEMLRIGALESQLYGHGDPFLDEKLLPPDPVATAAFMSDNQRAIDLADQAVRAAPDDAHARYDLGAAWALRGTYEFTVRKSYMAALGDAKRARRQAEAAVKLDPAFVDPQIILGAHNYIAGSLPLGAKMFSAIAGYSGDQQLGLRQLTYVAAHGEYARTDAQVLLAVIDRRDGRNRAAAAVLADLDQEYPRNVLFAVETAESLEASGEHDPARAQYDLILARAQAHAPGYERAPLDKVWYDLGNIDRLYSRWSAAWLDYQNAERAPRALPRYIQAAALAAGGVALKLGDNAGARAEFQRCIALDPASPAGKAARQALAASVSPSGV